jgi:hypothetical protein
MSSSTGRELAVRCVYMRVTVVSVFFVLGAYER